MSADTKDVSEELLCTCGHGLMLHYPEIFRRNLFVCSAVGCTCFDYKEFVEMKSNTEDFWSAVLVVALLVFSFLSFVATIGALALLPAWIVMFGWNWVGHETFGAPALSFWQCFFALWALGIIAARLRGAAEPKKEK